mgnify:CR=1 FL=1
MAGSPLRAWVYADAQSVKNTGSARENGYDAGKKVSGVKRHIAVDTNGLLQAVTVTTANVTDRDGAVAMTKQHRDALAACLGKQVRPLD